LSPITPTDDTKKMPPSSNSLTCIQLDNLLNSDAG